MTKRILKLFISLLYRNFEILSGFLFNFRRSNKCIVLMYHEVTNENFNRFLRQIGIIKKFSIPVSIDSLTRLETGKNKNYVILTFDDGFAETISRILPVLTQENIPAIFFIPAGFLGKAPTWIKDEERRKTVGAVINAQSLKVISRWKGITIGSHGLKHRPFTEMNIEDAEKELVQSKKVLEGITESELHLFAFPYGAFQDHHVAMARETGYHHLFTIEPTILGENGFHSLIGRVEVSPDDWDFEFKLKLLGSYRWLSFILPLKNKIFHKKSSS